jgi:hypothetical protein
MDDLFQPVMGSDQHGCPTVNMKAAQAEYVRVCGLRLDQWVVGGCGTEVPFFHDQRWTLYVWNPFTAENGYLDLATDVVTVDRDFLR